MDLTSFFGGEIDDSVDAPDELIIDSKRRRKEVNYANLGQRNEKKALSPDAAHSPTKPASRMTKRGNVFASAVPPVACKPAKVSSASSSAIDLTESTDENSDSSESETKQSPSPSKKTTYTTALPVTREGLKIRIAGDGYKVIFGGYMKNNDGTVCLAQKQGLFRNIGDRIIGINGVSIKGRTHQEVIQKIKDAKANGAPVVTLKMEEM